MNDNILFIFNIFPGVGGLESVSNNIIDYISKDFTIYTLSMCMMPNIPASPNIAKHSAVSLTMKKRIFDFQ